MVSDGKTIRLNHFNGIDFESIDEWRINSGWLIENCYNEEFSNIYFEILIKYNFDIVHIHHLIFHTFDLPKLCKKLNIPLILSFHDLYFMCPAYTLIDGDHVFCHGRCLNSTSKSNCYIPMKNITKIKIMKSYVYKWRDAVSEMFLNIDYFIAPSQYIKNIIIDTYLLKTKNFKVIEHGINVSNLYKKLYEIPQSDKTTKILFLGNLYFQKGSSVIRELYDLDKNSYLEFHFLGHVPKELEDIGVNHGKYELENLPSLINEIKPSFIGIFSICAESYCYTLSESWSLEIPVLVSELGALKERLLKNDGGWFIDVNNISDSYQMILDIKNNPIEYISKQNNIKNIKLPDIDTMVNEYQEIYIKLI